MASPLVAWFFAPTALAGLDHQSDGNKGTFYEQMWAMDQSWTKVSKFSIKSELEVGDAGNSRHVWNRYVRFFTLRR